jgi:transcriptional regulator with XRE-family HTH domain
MNNIANKIRDRRKILAYSVRELAILSNISEKDIVAYETNRKSATLKTLKKIANSTRTKVNDWVDNDYFKRSVDIKNLSCKNNNQLAITFFREMFRADDIMETLHNALINMKEIQLNSDNEVILSEFSEKIYQSIASIKLKIILETLDKNISVETNSNNETVTQTQTNNNLSSITSNDLSQEMAIIFKNIDTMDTIIQALINIDYIDSNGICSDKVKLLLDAIISNKINKYVRIKKQQKE